MRIITGILKGRRLQLPGGLDVRPTTDRVKEGLFSVMASRRYIQNCTVLDLFAGSGNLGFEALSRGAKDVLFVDHERRNIQYIEKMAKEFEMEEQVRTATLDAAHFLQGPAIPYDIIMADPPYVYREVEQIVKAVIDGGWLKDGGWLVFEHNKHHDFSEHPHFLFEKEYGRTYLSFLQGQKVALNS
jgi:16S rRNA (guanine(966)-N(2))-methyltransferase RsmD